MPIQHLYLHVPFCLRRCSYCDFAVTATREPPLHGWLDAVGRELKQVVIAEGWSVPLELRTVYVGGGTPSLLGPGAMAMLRDRLAIHAVWDDAAEWTVEANPETFDERLARDWRDAGVNRLSLGAQTFDADALRWMGRLHGPEGPARAVAAARGAGFADVSLDLIFGLPSRLGRDWDADLQRLLELQPEHVSLYGLTAETSTPLGRWVREGTEVLADEEAYEHEYLYATARLGAAGYEHYEVSNFARPGRSSRHNRAYWDGAAYVGLGPGAHSFLPPRRWWNTRDWSEYAGRLGRGDSPRDGAEEVKGVASSLERVWLGLRTASGLAATTARQGRLGEVWRTQGWAEAAEDGRIRLTPRGWLLLDRLAVEFEDAAA